MVASQPRPTSVASSANGAPNGLKPLAAVKLLPWNEVTARAMIARTGTPTFHQVAALLVLASLRTPRKLIAVKIAISTIAATTPDAVRTCWPWLSFIQPLAKE